MKWRSKRRAAVVGAVVASTLATSSPAGAGPKMHAFNWGGNPAFGYGGVGNVVGFWQRILYASSNIWGDSNPCLGADGYYGNSTFWGTAAFQQKLGVPVDGVTGSRTLSAAFTYRRPDGILALQWGGGYNYSYYTGNADSAGLAYASATQGWKWQSQSGPIYDTDYAVRTITLPIGSCRG